MSLKATEITRKDLIIKAKRARIKDFDEMSGTQLVNAYNKYLKNRKSHNIYKKFCRISRRNIDKRQNQVTYKDLLDYEESRIMRI